jgi:hypothetical protein
MSQFVLIGVDMHYDHVDGVDCLSSHATKEAAEAVKAKWNTEYVVARERRNQYVQAYIQGQMARVPDTGLTVAECAAQFPYLAEYMKRRRLPTVRWSELKKMVEAKVSALPAGIIPGFDPPPVPKCYCDLYVLEVPEAE